MYSEIASPVVEKPAHQLSDSARLLVEKHLPMVRSIVQAMCMQFPSHADVEEMHSLGVLGLIEAARRYDAEQGRTFEVYAAVRIRGSVLDELRRMDWMPRTARKRARDVQRKVAELEQALGRVPTDVELQKALNMDSRTFRRVQRQIMQFKFFSLDAQKADAQKSDSDVDFHDAIPDDRQPISNEQVEKKELLRIMQEHIERLPDRYQDILSMYYFKNMRLSEIAAVYQVSEARICQIHTQAVKRLRATMQPIAA